MSVCLSCSGNNINLIYDFGNLPAVNSFYSMENINSEEFFPMVLNVCNDCYLVQIENVPSPEKLYKEYHISLQPHLEMLSTLKILKIIFHQNTARIQEFLKLDQMIQRFLISFLMMDIIVRELTQQKISIVSTKM